MKVYANGMKATEFGKKQISAIYAAAKRGDLKVERWAMSDLYNMADYYNYDSNGNAARAEQKILAIIDKVFAGKMDEAQELIDAYTESTWTALGIKDQKKASRELVA